VLAVLLLVDARVAIGRVPIEGRTLLRALVASAGAGLAGWLAVDILGDTGGFPVGLALAGAVMVVLAMLLRIVPGQDAVWLEANVGGLFGGWFGRGIKRCAGA
jgi:hypothetical protein